MKEVFNGDTPNGGIKSIIFYLDSNNNNTEKHLATKARIIELDKDNNIIKETFGILNKTKQ